jgi:hypothetical protein
MPECKQWRSASQPQSRRPMVQSSWCIATYSGNGVIPFPLFFWKIMQNLWLSTLEDPFTLYHGLILCFISLFEYKFVFYVLLFFIEAIKHSYETSQNSDKNSDEKYFRVNRHYTLTVVCATQCFLVSMSTKDSQVDPGYIQISFVFEKNIDVNEVNRVRCNLFEEQTA